MLLYGMRLAWVLDLIDRHHKLLGRLFNMEYDPMTKLSDQAKALCNKIRDLVSPYIEVLFVTVPAFEDKIKQRVWNGIYERIRFAIASPYRFSHISHHRHLRLDDHVQRLLSKHTTQSLPMNFEEANYGLPRYLQEGSFNRFPRAVKPITNVILLGQHTKNDMIYSPTAEVMAGPVKPVAETYCDPLRGHLRRPTPIRIPGDRPQCSSSPGTSSSISDSTEADHNDSSSDETDSDSDSGSDLGEEEYTPSSHRSHCSLCDITRKINMAVASIRVEALRGKYLPSNLPGIMERASKQFEKEWFEIQASEASRSPRYFRVNPDDERNWSALTKALLEFLTMQEQEAKKARRDRLMVLLTEPRPGQDVEIYEDEDSDDEGDSDSDEEKTDEDKENDRALRELSWFLNRVDVEDLEDDDQFAGTVSPTTMTTPERGYKLPPFTLDGRPLIFLR
ncbi:hypothetical protein F5Y13DRAFT_165958 [Hypoxylon sp. FL1857]|nr:hypothetical protein F5Y13DRAFT_165958 [Hypoxylon sp. FL1857]